MTEYLDSGLVLDSGSVVGVPDPHYFWTTPFDDYTVTEGLLLLLLVAVGLAAVFKLFK